MTLRFRLTLVSTVVLGIVLTSFGSGVYILMNKTLHDNLDAAIVQDANDVASYLQTLGTPIAYQGNLDTFAEFVSPDGTVATIGATTIKIVPDAATLAMATGQSKRRYFYKDVVVGSAPLRLFAARIDHQDPTIHGVVMVFTSRQHIIDTLRRLRLMLLWAGVVGLGLAAILAFSAARTALRPVEEVAAAAGEIGRTGDMSRRVDPAGEEELGRLTTAFNGMLDRLEHAQTELERTLDAQKRFLADASHELRTPLTTMRGNLEVMRSAPAISKKDMEDALRDSIEEAERMSRLVEDLLALARSDAQAAPVVREPVGLAEVTRDAVESAAAAGVPGGSDGPRVHLDARDDVVVSGSPDLLRRLVTNLVENAIKYTPKRGDVNVLVRRENGWAVLQVADSGIGMSEEELAHAFDRFWRSDRSRGERGSGLGLAIAKAVVEEHGGAIAASSKPGEGTTMTVRLPVSANGGAAASQGDIAIGGVDGPAINGTM